MKNINCKRLKTIFLSLLFLLLLSSSVSAEDDTILFKKKYNVASGEKLIVEVSAADVEIKTWNRDEVQVLVTGEKSITEYLNFSFTYNNGVVSVISKQKSSWNIWHNIDDLDVNVILPSNFDIELKTSGGDIDIENLNGIMKATTSGGDIEIDNSEGSLVAKTSGGDVEISRFNGDVVLKTSGGDIEAKRILGNIEAKTSGGDVQLFVSKGKVTAATSGGDIALEYKGENMGIELNTSGGDIKVLLPSNFEADVLLESLNNSIDNNFKETEITEVTKSKFDGKFNSGGKVLNVRTSGGSIIINER